MSERRTPAPPAPRVELEPDINKVVASICLLISLADAEGRRLTQYDIVKSLFFADKTHLNEFGRPITYDNYVAMWHGPVPSLSYDLLKLNQDALKKYGIDDLPWSRTSADHVTKGCYHFFGANTEMVSEELAPSDVKALTKAAAVVSGLTFHQVRELTHNDVAYKEAWRLAGDMKSYLMSLGLLFDTPDFDAAEQVEFVSRQKAMCEGLNDDRFSSFRRGHIDGRRHN